MIFMKFLKDMNVLTFEILMFNIKYESPKKT